MLILKNDVDGLADKILFFMNNIFHLESVNKFDIKKTIYDFLSLNIFVCDD